LVLSHWPLSSEWPSFVATVFLSKRRPFTRLFITLLFNAIGTAVFVRCNREILFSRRVFGGLRKLFHWPFALLAKQCHLRAGTLPAVPSNSQARSHGIPGLFSSSMLGGFADFYAFVPAFFNLTLAGVLLGLAYQRHRQSLFSNRTSCRWIFWMKTYGSFTASAPRATTSCFWGTGKMVDGCWRSLCLVPHSPFLNFCRSKGGVSHFPFHNDPTCWIGSKPG